MPTLQKYLEEEFPEAASIIKDKDLSDTFNKFLTTTLVLSEQNINRSLSTHGTLTEMESYTSFIDTLLSYLIQENVPSILTTGYSDPSANSMWKSKLVNASSNLHVKLLRGKNWRTLFSIIGGSGLWELILKHKAFEQIQGGRFVQVFGCLSKSGYKNVQGITKSMMLHKTRDSCKVSSLFPSSCDALLECIYASELGRSKRISKKFRKFSIILRKVVANDGSCRYNNIFETMIPISSDQPLLKNSTPIQLVVKFVLTVMNKLFPLEVWGTVSNRAQVTDRVVEFINAASNDKTLYNQVTKSIKISDIEWLGRSKSMTSHQDFMSRGNMFNKFLGWFFTSFIQKVIRLFWHVTESATVEDSKLYYFPHSVWNTHRSAFMSKYIESFLILVTDSDSHYIKAIRTRFNHGNSRLIPKVNDFRLICVPSRMPFNYPISASDKDKQIFEYLNYINETINPIRHILKSRMDDIDKSRQLNCTPRCYSVGDVARNLGTYKASLLDKYDHKLPELFFVKFDMRHCYDNLDHTKIIEGIDKLFANEESSKSYFVRNYYSSKIGRESIRKPVSFVKPSDQLEEFDLELVSNSKGIPKGNTLIDRSKMFKFSKSEILSVCKSQILDSLMLENYNYYRRKAGVYQGFPLSATFCDIVYNSLVDDQFSFLESDPENLLLRVVDDFLLVTTNIAICKKVTRIINGSSLNGYGAFVNIDKTQIVGFQLRATALKFIGLDINTVTLEITREFPKDSFPALRVKRSFQSSYSYLAWSYSSRLSDFLMSIESGSLDSVLQNLNALLASVLHSFNIHFHRIAANDKFEVNGFKKFLLDLLERTLSRFESLNSSNAYNEIITLHFQSTTCDCLSKQSRFKDIIQWISGEASINM